MHKGEKDGREAFRNRTNFLHTAAEFGVLLFPRMHRREESFVAFSGQAGSLFTQGGIISRPIKHVGII